MSIKNLFSLQFKKIAGNLFASEINPARLFGALVVLVLATSAVLSTLSFQNALEISLISILAALIHTAKTFSGLTHGPTFKAPVFLMSFFTFTLLASAMTHWMTFSNTLELILIGVTFISIIVSNHQSHKEIFCSQFFFTILFFSLYMMFPIEKIESSHDPIVRETWGFVPDFLLLATGISAASFVANHFKLHQNSFGSFFIPVFALCVVGFSSIGFQAFVCAFAMVFLCFAQSKFGYYILYRWLLKSPKFDLNHSDIHSDVSHSFYHLCKTNSLDIQTAQIKFVSHSKLPFYNFIILCNSSKSVITHIPNLIDKLTTTLNRNHQDTLTFNHGIKSMDLILTPESAHEGLIWMQKKPKFSYDHNC